MFLMSVGKVLKLDHLAFAPDGQSLVGCTDFGAYLWCELRDGQKPEHLSGTSRARFARFTPDGGQLFVAGHELVRRDTASGNTVVVPLWNMHPIRFDLSPDGNRLIVEQWVNGRGLYDTRVACRPASDPTEANTFWVHQHTGPQHHRPQFLPGGDRFVQWDDSQLYERRIVTYDAATGEEVMRSAPYQQTISTSFLSPDGRWLAGLRVGADITRVFIWPLDPTADEPACITNDTKKGFTGVAFHPAGRFVAITSNDKTVKLYDTATWEPARTFTWDIGKVRSVCFSPDGTLAAAGSDTGKVILWDVDL